MIIINKSELSSKMGQLKIQLINRQKKSDNRKYKRNEKANTILKK
jgi:hypothetical protein